MHCLHLMVRFLRFCVIFTSGTDTILNIGHQLIISGTKKSGGGQLQVSMNGIVSIIDLKSETNEPCSVLFNQTFPEGYYLVNMTILPTTAPSLPAEVKLTGIS